MPTLIIDKSTPLQLAETLSAVLRAVMNAQQESAITTVEFIKNLCSEETVNDQKQYSFQTVSFRYTKLDETNQPASFVMEMPILGLVNTPLLSVKKAQISLAYEAFHETKATNEPTRKASQLMTRFVPKSRSSSEKMSGNLNVTIEIEQAGSPPAFDRFLDMIELSSTSKKEDE